MSTEGQAGNRNESKQEVTNTGRGLEGGRAIWTAYPSDRTGIPRQVLALAALYHKHQPRRDLAGMTPLLRGGEGGSAAELVCRRRPAAEGRQ